MKPTPRRPDPGKPMVDHGDVFDRLFFNWLFAKPNRVAGSVAVFAAFFFFLVATEHGWMLTATCAIGVWSLFCGARACWHVGHSAAYRRAKADIQEIRDLYAARQRAVDETLMRIGVENLKRGG